MLKLDIVLNRILSKGYGAKLNLKEIGGYLGIKKAKTFE